MWDDGHRSRRVTLAVIRQSSITVPLRSAACKLGRRAFNIHLDSACPIIKASIYPVNLHDARHAFTHRLIDGEAVEPVTRASCLQQAFHFVCVCFVFSTVPAPLEAKNTPI